MGKNITVGEGHTTSIKIDHRNGKQTEVENKVEIRPVMEGYHNETIRDKYYFGRDFLTIFPEDLYNLIVHGKMSGAELRVLFYLVSRIDKENVTFTNLDIIAADLGMHRNNVSTYINKLIKRHLIIETKVQRRTRTGAQTLLLQIPLAQLNYNLCFNSQTKEYKKVRNDHPQITLTDGQTLISPHAEAQRQKLIRERLQKESLFPEFYAEQEEVSPALESFDSETGEVFSD